jgi:V8-like Glu-specific endopeptidase
MTAAPCGPEFLAPKHFLSRRRRHFSSEANVRQTTRLLLALTVAAAACGDQTPTSSLAPSDSPALVSNGTPTGSLYGAVGNLFADADNDGVWDWRCSGTLVTSTVFLTAGHCYEPGATYYITFAAVAFPAPKSLPQSGLISSTSAYLHPQFSYPSNDLAVIILPEAQVAQLGITPIPVAPAGYLDDLRSQPGWGTQTVRVVGYGLASYGQGKYVTQDDAVRRYADMKVLQLTPMSLFTHNSAPRGGKPGACYGDSGGPLILNGFIVAVVSHGWYDGGCHSISGQIRTDTESAISFLDNFIDY